MHIPTLRAFLMNWEFWALEAQFAFLVIVTIVEVRRLQVRRTTIVAAGVLAAFAWLLTATLPPRTSRIFYDEQIYQDVGRNLSDLHRAQMCNDGTVEYGRLECSLGEYNKEPYGYSYLLSLVYRVTGAGDSAAYKFNNVVAGLAVLLTVVLADLLFRNSLLAILSGIALTLFPMQLQWANTAAAEPTAALLCAASVLAAVQFTRTRTTSALVWTIAVAAFATTARPECVLIVPVIALVLLLLAPDTFRERRLWLAALGGAAAAWISVLHMIAVQQEGWGTTGPQFSLHHARHNFSTNFWFFVWDERFPAFCGAAAVIGLLAPGKIRERTLLLGYFLAFWTVFLFFYAGSYNYGADVRYSLMTYVPVAILAAAGLWRIAEWMRTRLHQHWTDRQLCASLSAILLAQFLWYAPLVRATGEEAWSARADVRFAKEFAARLPPNSLVLTHNPSMFHVWNVSAAQVSFVRSDPRRTEQLFARYAGGVYLHWNFWCNVPDPMQSSFCGAALDEFPHELVYSRRERDFTFALYKLQPRPRLMPEPQK